MNKSKLQFDIVSMYFQIVAVHSCKLPVASFYVRVRLDFGCRGLPVGVVLAGTHDSQIWKRVFVNRKKTLQMMNLIVVDTSRSHEFCH